MKDFAVIKSRDNGSIKRARAVRDGRARELIFIEGVRLCEEALAAGLTIKETFYTQRLTRDERGGRLLDSLKGRSQHLHLVSENVFASLSDTETPQGIVILAARPQTDRGRLENDSEVPLVVIAHRLNNPTNAGAVLRTAEAAGATGVIITNGCADIFAPKALRGAMGSSFRLPLWNGPGYSEALDWCAGRGIRTFCTDTRAEQTHTEVDWAKACALIVGAEASGLSAEEVAEADEAVRIPMRFPVDSLNVAVATGVVLYEAARQRAQGAS